MSRSINETPDRFGGCAAPSSTQARRVSGFASPAGVAGFLGAAFAAGLGAAALGAAGLGLAAVGGETAAGA
ncbi:MAG: hypothetical protein AAF684_10665, partial [Pseudomonadota bacterium]